MATGKRLNSYVHVTDEHGASHAFGPDDDVPGWARSAIRNDAVWADPDHVTDATPAGENADAEDAPKRRGRPPRES